MEKKRKSIARRITAKISVRAILVAIALSFVLMHFEGKAARESYTDMYYNKMLITKEHIRRVVSDVSVAVTNNIYYIEHTLDQPDIHKETMARIVKDGTRLRSCGITFIADYYPQKGHNFCPFAWRSTAAPDVIYSEDLGDAAFDYLKSPWFHRYVEADSCQWTDPFYGGHNFNSPTAAYMAPVHDADGRVVAMVGADISLDWLAGKLGEADSLIVSSSVFPANSLGITPYVYLINHDGRFITHPDEKCIMKDNFFSHIGACDGSDIQALVEKMKAGTESEGKVCERIVVDGVECFMMYTPVKYTKWLLVYAVPCSDIDLQGYINSTPLLLLLLLAVMLVVFVCHEYVRSGLKPLRQLVSVAGNIAKGDFSTPMLELKHNDELALLSDSIEEMKYQLSNYTETR